MRHAKAEKDYSDKSDFDRNLTEKGIAAAKIIGKEMQKLQIIPELIYCSAAARTKQTAKQILQQIDKKIDIQYFEDLYFGDKYDIFSQIQNLDKNINSIMLVGHNPTMEELFTYFDIERRDAVIKTANVAVFDCKIDKWHKLQPFQNKLTLFLDHRNIN